MESNEANKVKAKSIKLKAFLILFRSLGLCFLLSALSFQHLHAQTFSEWFRQKKTQIKYLTDQVAALNAFETSLRQGYNELKSGWTAIGNFKDGELGLYETYYQSLSQVNPEIAKSTDMAAIRSEQQSIIGQFNAIGGLNGLTTGERAYIQSVQQNIIAGCAKDMADLQTVLSPGDLSMSDDERIKRIAGISGDIRDKYLFTCHFSSEVRLLAIERDQEDKEVQTLRQYDGINE
jgi:hypothetical protein